MERDVADSPKAPVCCSARHQTPTERLFWYRAITVIWFPIQAAVVFGAIWYATHAGHLSGWEKLGLFFGIGVMSGTIGMVYAHELLHQKPGHERWLGDLILAANLYSHFRTEHLLVHHAWVATPRDAVSARYNEGFFRYFLRVLRDCPRSAWVAETRLLARARRPVWDRRNPFWRYAALQLGMLALAFALGGWQGLALFVWQAFVAILPVRTVGVMGDGRTYDFACALRAVTSVDGMTADYYPFTHEFLGETATRIINEVKGINRCTYDITSKPPGTIEWE